MSSVFRDLSTPEPIDLANEADLTFGGIHVFPPLCEVRAGPTVISVEPRVMKVLVALGRTPDIVISRDELVRQCWGGRIVGDDAINSCIAKVRRLAGLTGDPAFKIETIPRIGYRLRPAETAAAPVLPATDAEEQLADIVPVTIPPAAARNRPDRKRSLIVIGAVTAAAMLLAAGYWLSPAYSGAILLVEPLQTAAADKPAQSVRDGLSGDLARVLAGKPVGLAVVQASDGALGRQRAQLILSGDTSTLGERLRVHVQLSDVSTRSILWSQNFASAPGEAEALREQVADKLGAVLNCALSTRHRGAAAIGDQAAVLYLKACDLISDYDLGSALDLLRQVTVLEPGFARAWADVGVTQALTADDLPPAQRGAALAEAEKAAQRALQIDPRTGLAYYALAAIQPGIANWASRMAIIEKGLAVEPDSSELNNIMGHELLRIGRSSEGLVYLKRSMELDPLNPVKTATLILPLAFYGDVDAAETLAARAIALWPQNPQIWGAVFRMEARAGDPGKALAMLRNPDRPSLRSEDSIRRWEATLRARLEPTAAHVDAAVAEWVRHAQEPEDDPLYEAEGLVVLGLTDLAYSLLANEAVPVDDSDEVMFRGDMAAFRANPRFLPLAERRGLVAVWRSLNRWPDACSERPAPQWCPT